jgi:hypothetical protein
VIPWGGPVSGDNLGRIGGKYYLMQGGWQYTITLAIASGRCYLGNGRWQVFPLGGLVTGVTLGRAVTGVMVAAGFTLGRVSNRCYLGEG